MPRPGTDIIIADATATGGAILDTGQALHLGLADRGPVDDFVTVRSMRDYENQLGLRAGGITAHDSARAFFTEGGAILYFGRLQGDAAAAATATVASLEATANSPGAWGDNVTVALEAETATLAAAGAAILANGNGGKKRRSKTADAPEQQAAGDLQVVVTLNGTVVERSTVVKTAGDAVDWATASSKYVDLTAADPAVALVATAAVPLAGGASDDAGVDADVATATLDRFSVAYGPAQVSYPGCTDPDIQAAILDHCDRTRRCPLLDASDTADPAQLAADALACQGKAGARMAALLAPPLTYPGPASGTTILVPYSAVQGGIIARSDRMTGNPNESAAGVNGISREARGLAHDYTDADREALNELGVTLAAVRYQRIRTYGSRTVAGPNEPNWTWFGNSRVIMAISYEADAVAENYVHRQIDGKGQLFARLNGDLRGVCIRYFKVGALYGDTPEDAFYIDTTSPNTVETINAGEIHAVIGLKCAPPGEWVLIELAKTPIEVALAA